LLIQSRRRCCLCFGLKANIDEKDGQIAHLDRNPSNNSLDNLAWLCLSHHDQYDSVRGQTKRLTFEEVKSYREQLYSQLAALMSKGAEEQDERFEDSESDAALKVIHRYSDADKAVTKTAITEVLNRIEQLHQFGHAYDAAMDSLDDQKLSDEQAELRYVEVTAEIREKLKMPDGIWGLHSDGPLPSAWKKAAEQLAKKWINGLLSYEECINIFWVLDEEHDTDLHYILFGLPNEDLSALQKCALNAFVYEYGQRNYFRRRFSVSEDVPF
jgi:hypothetical protein